MKLGDELTFEQEMKVMSLLLGLCPDCSRQVGTVLQQMGMRPSRMIRNVLWKWISEWPHGESCPQEARDAWETPVGAEAPKEEVSAS